MTKIKISIRKKRFILKVLSLCLSTVAFLLVFFESTLTLHGGWDDINYDIIFTCPLIAAISMIFAIINNVKFRSKSYEIVPALSMVAISALFFCYVMVYTTTSLLASS
ncbi:MAG: hypothetical protein MJ154_03200 [Candidatus Saccharibacteria bacterium]|nr:hypothetical protein [Candidatus Saccharibacteria bacterium]